MDTKLEKQLTDLVEDVGGKGPAAIYAVLHMLHQCYLEGRHNEFAKHCCAFAPIGGAALNAASPETAEGGDRPGPSYLN